MTRIDINTIISGVFGGIIGDMVGVPVENYTRFSEKELLNENDINTNYGSNHQPKGTWSDDTSMTLCTLETISICKNINFDNLISLLFKWLNEAHWTPYNCTWDCGNICRKALTKYNKTNCNPIEVGEIDENSNGNGSLIRMLPIAFWCFSKKLNYKETFELAKNTSSLTHRHPISIVGCYIYINIIIDILNGCEKQELLKNITIDNRVNFLSYEYISAFNKYEILQNVMIDDIENIKSSGYIIDTLQAALYSFLNTEDFTSCIIKSINLGGDTDSVAFVAGTMCGIWSELNNKMINQTWFNQVSKKDEIIKLCHSFYLAI